MRKFLFAAMLACGLAVHAPAQAVTADDIYIVEQPNLYTLVNTTSDWFVYAFFVTNPNAGANFGAGTFGTAAAAGWAGYPNFFSANPIQVNDVCPGCTSLNLDDYVYYYVGGTPLGQGVFPNFTFDVTIASGTGIIIEDSLGNQAVLEGVAHTPLPAALPLMGSVLGGGLVIGRWRKRRRAALAAA